MANQNPRSVPKDFPISPVDPFRKLARIHRMNPMNHKQVFELLQILDRIQVEVDYVETFPLAVERVRAILLDVRKFEKANGLYSPACFSTQGDSK